MVPVVPNLVFKESVVALVLVAVIFVFSVFFDAPLLEKANPAYSLNPTKAPWYFAGVQELLMHFHPVFAAFVIPLAVLGFLVIIPFLRYPEAPNGRWFISDQGKRSAWATAQFAFFVTLSGILANEYFLDFETLLSPVPAFVSNGIVPLFLLLTMMFGFYRVYLLKCKLSKAELVQAVFVFIMVAFVLLSLIGIFFRGKDMGLSWPWNVF
jgi:hypothetical protein